MCDCIRLTFSIDGDPLSTTIDVSTSGTWDGANYFEFNVGNQTFYLYRNTIGDQWEVSDVLGGLSNGGTLFLFFKSSGESDCPPLGTTPAWSFANDFFDEWIVETGDCFIQTSCDCGITMFFQFNLTGQTFELVPIGTSNGRDVYEFYFDFGSGLEHLILGWNDILLRWEIGSLTTLQSIAYLDFNSNCPLGRWNPQLKGVRIETIGTECETCDREERIFRKYDSIKLPEIFVEDNRGDISCCCKYLVLAGNGTESWKNDKTSAWIKISNSGDVFEFQLSKHGVPTNYIPTPKPFVNEPNAFFTTIEWSDVLNSDGVGCYHLSINYEISGIVGSIPIGDFDLKPYSVENALKTARVRAIFDGYHETDGINFSGSNVESTFRFFGYIGNRQPNTEIDNIIYQNREMKRVIRENLNTYELITDPENECIIKPLLDLYLLSENQLWISDHNAHNHSYRYLDLPVILNESASVEYKDFSRLAVLKCKFEDKFKNNRTYYGNN
jgi:hypothetical protein